MKDDSKPPATETVAGLMMHEPDVSEERVRYMRAMYDGEVISGTPSTTSSPSPKYSSKPRNEKEPTQS